MPTTRPALCHKFNVGGHKGYLHVGLQPDGAPGELFVRMDQVGSTLNGYLDALGTAVSYALQWGAPVGAMVRKFEHFRFDPGGYTDNPEIPLVPSVVAYIFRWVGCEFVPGYREETAVLGAAPGGPPEASPESGQS
jgi:ribonucleoside-diphosphate reductase alpha chain